LQLAGRTSRLSWPGFPGSTNETLPPLVILAKKNVAADANDNDGIALTLFLTIALGLVALWWGSWYSMTEGGIAVIVAVVGGNWFDKNFLVVKAPTDKQ